MIITSYGFAAFVLISLLIYYLLPRRAQNFWLLTVSYIFHVTWAWQYAAILLAITAINFAVPVPLSKPIIVDLRCSG
jgi:alginate O-acetyltransferase complex protein AlgI